MSLRQEHDGQAVLLSGNGVVTETRARSFAKAVSYRVISSLLTGSIFFGATQRARLALALALIDSVIKIVVFYIHERAWMKIVFGRLSRAPKTESSQRSPQTDLELNYEPL
jgi:uncharacterized membrane protein